jgi:hypothetical protein
VRAARRNVVKLFKKPKSSLTGDQDPRVFELEVSPTRA